MNYKEATNFVKKGNTYYFGLFGIKTIEPLKIKPWKLDEGNTVGLEIYSKITEKGGKVYNEELKFTFGTVEQAFFLEEDEAHEAI